MKIRFDKPRSIPVSVMLYPDRGMLKWQGFILSDHNEVMDLERAVRAAAIEDLPQEPDVWNRLLRRSLETGIRLHLRVEAEEGLTERIGYVRAIHPRDFTLTGEERHWRIDFNVVKAIREIDE